MSSYLENTSGFILRFMHRESVDPGRIATRFDLPIDVAVKLSEAWQAAPLAERQRLLGVESPSLLGTVSRQFARIRKTVLE